MSRCWIRASPFQLRANHEIYVYTLLRQLNSRNDPRLRFLHQAGFVIKHDEG